MVVRGPDPGARVRRAPRRGDGGPLRESVDSPDQLNGIRALDLQPAAARGFDRFAPASWAETRPKVGQRRKDEQPLPCLRVWDFEPASIGPLHRDSVATE